MTLDDSVTIADAILNRSNMGTATRIALKQKGPDGFERDLGGLNRDALIVTIQEAIRTLSSPPAGRQGGQS